MKNLLCCILVLGFFSSILGSNDQNDFVGLPSAVIEDITSPDNTGFLFNKKLESDEFSSGSYKFEFDDGNPDVHGNIKRPCQAYDTFCIRKFFTEHSRCKISGRRVPNPFFRAQSLVTYPSANMSAVTSSTRYTGMDDARVEEFYINTVTNNLVIAFSFDTITQASNYTSVKFYLRGREPEIHRGFGSLIYKQITVTMVIPDLHNLRLDRAEITTYASNPVLPFAVSPTLALSTNPETLAMVTYFITVGLENEHIEELSTEGVFFSGNFLQYNICDFGIKIL